MSGGLIFNNGNNNDFQVASEFKPVFSNLKQG